MVSGSDGRMRLGALVASYVVYMSVYTLINRLSVGRPAHTLFLPGERAIPLVPSFAYVYAAGFVLPLIVLARRLQGRDFSRLLRAFWLASLTAFFTFAVFPVALFRPEIPRTGGAWLLRLIYVDRPYNDFPSLHVVVVCLVYLACRGYFQGPWLLAATLAVSASTILIRQHYVADVLAGAGLAIACWRLAAPRSPPE